MEAENESALKEYKWRVSASSILGKERGSNEDNVISTFAIAPGVRIDSPL